MSWCVVKGLNIICLQKTGLTQLVSIPDHFPLPKLKYLSQIESMLRVSLTQIFSHYSESRVEFKFHQWLNFLGQNNSIFSFCEDFLIIIISTLLFFFDIYFVIISSMYETFLNSLHAILKIIILYIEFSLSIYWSWNLDWLNACLRRRVVQFRIVISASYYTLRGKIESFWHEKLSHCGTKIRPGKVGSWRIFESNWLNIKSQFDSTLWVNLTQHWESNRLNIKSHIYSTLGVKLTQNWEWTWLNIESQIDSTLRVKLDQQW